MPKILCFLPLLFSCCCIAQTNTNTINITAFGAKPNSGEDATTAVREALAYASVHHKKALQFPKGRYDFYPDRASEKYLFTSNNDEGLKCIIFDLSNFNGFQIDGQGASFIFHGYVSPFLLESARQISLKNFTIDWSRTFSSEATIVDVDAEGIVLSVADEYPYKINNGLLIFTDTAGNEYPYGSMLEFDPQKHETAYMAEDYYFEGNLPVTEIKPGIIKLLKKGMKGTKGNVMVFNPAKRLCSAITVSDSRNLSFDSITIYHCGGMGIIAQRSGNIDINHYNVTRNPQTDRVLSITADATHFVNCSGKITLENSLFENQMDDATNIHGIYVQVTKKIAAATAEVMLKHEQQMGFDFIKPGQKLELVHNTTMEAYDTLTVKSVTRINKQYSQVEFTTPLPKDLVIGKDVLASIDDYPDVLIKNCIIQKNRARGMLIGTRGKVEIAYNYFHTPGAAILFEGDGSYWFEQAGVRNVELHNNVFDNCNYGVWGNAVIQIGSGVEKQYQSSSRYNRNIRIFNNTFNVFDARIIHAYSVDGLRFYNNIIHTTNAYANSFPNAKSFDISNSSNVVIQNNQTSDTSKSK